MREIGIGARRTVLRADAAHEARNDAALGQIVEHRELFRDVDRVVCQRSARPRIAILIVFVRWFSALAIRLGAGIKP
jgi:hypothetical protein